MAPRMRTSLLWTLATASTALGFAIPRSAHEARQVQSSELLEAYDYVIVGGGVGGLTVADRLTEDPATTVLVLEAGVRGDPAEVLPATAGGNGWTLPAWKFESVPQPNLGNRTSVVWIGNLVGGGSAINAMMAARGSAEDYDRWGRPFGDDDGGWNWKGILPYFKKVSHAGRRGRRRKGEADRVRDAGRETQPAAGRGRRPLQHHLRRLQLGHHVPNPGQLPQLPVPGSW